MSDQKHNQSSENASWIHPLGAALNIGFQVSITLIAAIGTGVYIDTKWGTAPIFLLSGVLIGLVAVFFLLKNIFKRFRDS